MFQTSFCGTASLPLCRILCFKLTTEPPKEQAQRWSFCIIVFFMSTTFYEISRKSAQIHLIHVMDLVTCSTRALRTMRQWEEWAMHSGHPSI